MDMNLFEAERFRRSPALLPCGTFTVLSVKPYNCFHLVVFIGGAKPHFLVLPAHRIRPPRDPITVVHIRPSGNGVTICPFVDSIAGTDLFLNYSEAKSRCYGTPDKDPGVILRPKYPHQVVSAYENGHDRYLILEAPMGDLLQKKLSPAYRNALVWDSTLRDPGNFVFSLSDADESAEEVLYHK